MDKLAKDFENEEEPELFKVVKYTFMGIFAYFVVLRMEVLVSLTMYVSARLGGIVNIATTVIL